MKTKVVGLIILLCALLICFGASAEHSGKWGSLDWVLDDNGTLTITGNGEMDSFKINNSIDFNHAWRPYRNEITHVEIHENVTSISMHAFIGCNNLKSVSIPTSVTSSP